jgi:TonB family protein
MAPIAKEPEALAFEKSNSGTVQNSGAKPQPAAAEIPVTVNGARAVPGSEKREPFSENTQTVLVFANGAVIRLASTVASGQLLFLTNQKSKKEVVCQVVKSKNYSAASGYVELEFTEAAPGFWGMRLPTAASAPVESGNTNVAPTASVPPMKSLEEKSPGSNSKTTVAPQAPVHQSAERPPVSAQHPPQSQSFTPAEAPKEFKAAPTAPAQPEIIGKIPTLSEFLTASESGAALKAPEKVQQEKTERKPESALQNVNEYAAQIQNQLSAKLFPLKPPREIPPAKITQPAKAAREVESKESLTSLLIPAKPKEDPAPGAYSFDFEADEVKIPAWLEPLARNLSTTAVLPEAELARPLDVITTAGETKTSEVEASISASEIREHSKSQPPAEIVPLTNSENSEALLTLSGDGPAPNFGSSLSIDSNSAETASASTKSRNALRLAVLAAGFLVAAGGGWYLYSTQSTTALANAPASGNLSNASSASLPDAAGAADAGSANAALSSQSNRASVNPQSIPTDAKGLSINGLKSPARSESLAAQPSVPEAAPFEESVKKSKLGKVRLAAPKLGRRVSAPDSSATDLAEALNTNPVAGGDAGDINALATKNSQPSAPVPVGGNVVPARLLSSVSPVYPQLARTQHLSGDVKIDALIDANGRVSATKVISGPALLHDAAVQAVRKWTYQPATLNGQPMPMHLMVTVQFKLQ